MSNNTPVVKQIYSCNGVNQTFAVPFFFLEGEESVLKVYHYDDATEQTTLLDLNVDYTINNPLTHIQTTLAYPVLDNIIVKRESDFVQLSEYVQGPFPFESIEEQFDRVVSLSQELNDKRALRLNDLDANEVFEVALPKGITLLDNFDRVLAINPTGTGIAYGPTVDLIEGSIDAVNQAVIDAALSASEALISEQNAATSETNSAVSEANTEFYANLFLFQEFIQVTFADSPVAGTIVDGALFLADDDLGTIEFFLPPLSTIDDNWKVAMIKQSATVNFLDILPSGSDTIRGNPSYQNDQKGIGAVFFKASATDWGVRVFAFTESTGINSVPDGGLTDAVLVKSSAADQDAMWDDMVFDGFSARFSKAWYSQGIRQTLAMILDLTYLGPLIASFTGSSNTLREKGATVSSVNLTVNVTKRSNPIAKIDFKQAGTSFQNYEPPVNVGSGATSATYSTPFSDNISFAVSVTDEIVGGDGPTTVSSTVSYSFVYPYYAGAGASGKTPSQVAALTKLIINSNANYNRAFTTANGDVYYFAYPAAYGNLTSILDENGFETFSAWTKTVANITGLDSNAVSYNIYESNNPVVAGSTNFTFKR